MNTTELRALDAAATPGPWHNYVANGGACSLRAGTGALDPSTALCGQKDGMLIAYLRNAVPDILALIEERNRLRAENATLRHWAWGHIDSLLIYAAGSYPNDSHVKDAVAFCRLLDPKRKLRMDPLRSSSGHPARAALAGDTDDR